MFTPILADSEDLLTCNVLWSITKLPIDGIFHSLSDDGGPRVCLFVFGGGSNSFLWGAGSGWEDHVPFWHPRLLAKQSQGDPVHGMFRNVL